MKNVITLLLILTLFIGCTTKEESSTENLNISITSPTKITDGEVIEYHKNGVVKIKGTLKNGKREGQWQSFFENGSLQSENKYVKGILSGKTAAYYPNGNLNYVGLYINDLKDGVWYFYLENGTLDKEVVFKEGEKIKVTP